MGARRLRYSQLKPALEEVAGRYVKRTRGHYQRDELVNAVWLMGGVQCLKSILYSQNRIKWDILDYIRSEQRLDRPIRHTTPKQPFSFIEIDNEDTLKYVLRDFSRMDKLIIRLKIIGYNKSEIARITGLPGRWTVRRRLQAILPALREALSQQTPL